MQHCLDWFKLNINATFIPMKIAWTNSFMAYKMFLMQQAIQIHLSVNTRGYLTHIYHLHPLTSAHDFRSKLTVIISNLP